eukprot:gene3342-4303_t
MTSIGSILEPGQNLIIGQRLVSDNQRYNVDIGIMEDDKEYRGDLNLWLHGADNNENALTYHTVKGTVNKFKQQAALPFLSNQLDGNLVLYAPQYYGDSSTVEKNIVLWASNTEVIGGSNNRLRIQDDGNLVLVNEQNNAVWSSGTVAPDQ